MLTRMGARLSDVRNWIGGNGRVVINKEAKSLEIQLSRRKTDQAGASPALHILGPILLDRKTLREMTPLSKVQDPLAISPYPSPAAFLQELQRLKKKAGIKSFIALRRARAQRAAKIAPMTRVAELLGHRPGSKSTQCYVGNIDHLERKWRLAMSE